MNKYFLGKEAIELQGNGRTSFEVEKKENKIEIRVIFHCLPGSRIDGPLATKKDVVVTVGNIEAVNEVLRSLGANGELLYDVESVLKRIDQHASEFDEEHNFRITLRYSGDNIDGVFYTKIDGEYRDFGVKYFTEKVASQLCCELKSAIELTEELNKKEVE